MRFTIDHLSRFVDWQFRFEGVATHLEALQVYTTNMASQPKHPPGLQGQEPGCPSGEQGDRGITGQLGRAMMV
jgi:hypothetical protein